MEILLKKVVSDFEFRSRNLFTKIACVWDCFLRVTRTEDAVTKPDRFFQVLNILLILLMVVMAPEKITQPDSVIFDGIRNSLRLLRKLKPL